ncbi:MAG: prephenate dehydratase [Planctomycetes bacterium]|nr:prephenate dehydratase [Planctomycetota bacterium]
MTKKKTTRRQSLPELQRKIERLDRDVVKQVNERAKLFEKIQKLQPEDHSPIVDVDGDQTWIEQLVGGSKGPLDARTIRQILGEMASGCRELVKPLRVAYLGPEYSYSHLAARERFGSSVELVPVATISAVFKEINQHQSDFGLVPLENSTDGRVTDTLDMFARLPVRICGEVQLRIHHFLLGKCERAAVCEVFSKPQALSQCRDWLSKHLPAARTVEMTSTAVAAQVAAEKPGAAAVASREAGLSYGLNVIAENIEDNKNNVTRFAVIGHETSRRTGNDKTSLMFEIPHSSGTLADAMGIFKRNRLNLTWIESFPMPGTKSEYLFFVELEGHVIEMKVKRALAALEKKTVRLEVLGSYAKSVPVE